MNLISKKDYPKEITISLEKYKADKKINTKCFVAHDYVQFEENNYMEDVKGDGYYLKQKIQIPIATMIKLLEKLKTCPHLQQEHLENKNYLCEEQVVEFAEWHFSDNIKDQQRFLYMIRDKDEKEWLEIPKGAWSGNKLEILKRLN